jgi:hypothetical protein
MGSIADLTYTNNMASNRKPLLTDLEESLDSIQDYINTTVVDAVNDILIDAWPSGYAVTTAGGGRFTTSDLYDKLTAVDNYTGGDITIATTAAWTDVDTTNAAITFTPDYLAGDFRVTVQFNVEIVTSNATNEAELRFRLTDGSSESTAIANVHSVSGVTTTTIAVPVTLVHEFDSLAASSQTVKLQYYIATTTATTIKVRASSTSPIALQVEKI